MIVELLRGFVNVTWPTSCLCCDESVERTGFCDSCAKLVEPRRGPRCVRCDAELPELPDRVPAHRCGRCLRRPPAFERAWGRFDYAGPVGDALRGAKYGRRLEGMGVCARLLGSNLPGDVVADPPDWVLPVPLRRARVRARGFHPTLLLARGVARAINRPCRWRGFRQVRATQSQAGLSDVERFRNVRGAFAAHRRFGGHDLLLVDDVMTTGATVDAAARALVGAGAQRVRVLAAARVVKDPG